MSRFNLIHGPHSGAQNSIIKVLKRWTRKKSLPRTVGFADLVTMMVDADLERLAAASGGLVRVAERGASAEGRPAANEADRRRARELLGGLEIEALRLSRPIFLSEGEAKLVWLAGVVAKGTALPDRSAETENPLVWAIVSSRRPDDPAVAQAVTFAVPHSLINRNDSWRSVQGHGRQVADNRTGR